LDLRDWYWVELRVNCEVERDTVSRRTKAGHLPSNPERCFRITDFGHEEHRKCGQGINREHIRRFESSLQFVGGVLEDTIFRE